MKRYKAKQPTQIAGTVWRSDAQPDIEDEPFVHGI